MECTHRLAGALAAVTLVAAPLAAHAAADWRFSASLYAYGPSIDGTTSFPPPVGGSSATIDAGTILDALKMNFAGTLEGSNGRWGGFTDVFYVNLGQMKSGTRDLSLGNAGLPAGVNANVDYNLKMTLWTLAGTYRLASTPTYTADLVAGARMLDVKQTLKWELTGNIAGVPVVDRDAQRNADAQNWDAIIGVKGRAAFGQGNKWFVPYYVDIGTGDSDLTWQAWAGVGYEFGWGSIVGVWRHVDYDLKKDRGIQSLSASGPAIGAVFRW